MLGLDQHVYLTFGDGDCGFILDQDKKLAKFNTRGAKKRKKKKKGNHSHTYLIKSSENKQMQCNTTFSFNI